MMIDICAVLTSICSYGDGDGDGADAADARRDVASLSGPDGTFTFLMTPRDVYVSTVKVEVHSSNSSSGAGSDENLSSSSSDRGSDPGTATGENDYEDIYEVRNRADGMIGVVGHNRGKESKSPSRDSGSHSRSGSMSSTGSGVGGGMGVVNSGQSVVVLHTSSGGTLLNSSAATVTNVTVDGCSTATTNMVVESSSNSIECYETVGAMTPGT